MLEASKMASEEHAVKSTREAMGEGKPVRSSRGLPKKTIKGKGNQKSVTFREGGLHRTTGTPLGEKIPADKMAAAKAGKYGSLGVKQANMATNMLGAGRAKK